MAHSRFLAWNEFKLLHVCNKSIYELPVLVLLLHSYLPADTTETQYLFFIITKMTLKILTKEEQHILISVVYVKNIARLTSDIGDIAISVFKIYLCCSI
jgi:hypothetical protein